jgi:hypothetical protein
MMKGEAMRRSVWAIAIMILLAMTMTVACGSRDKEPAELAMKAAGEAIDALKAEAVKIVPDQVAALESALGAAKDKIAKKEYKAALAEAQGLVGQAKEVAEAAKAKKDEWTGKWTELSQGLPKMVEAVQSRVDILSRAKKLPANMTAEKLADVKSGLAAVKEGWAKAEESFKSGKLADALSAANGAKEVIVKAMEALGMPVPPAAKS